VAVRRGCVIVTTLLPSLKRPQPVYIVCQGHILCISMKEFGGFTCLATTKDVVSYLCLTSGCSVLVNHALGIHCHALVSQTNFHCISGYTAKMGERTVTLCRTMELNQRPDHDHHPLLPAACKTLKGRWIRKDHGETHMCVHNKVCKAVITQQGCADRYKLHLIATEPGLHVKADRVLQFLLMTKLIVSATKQLPEASQT